jgi:hypothetical protein
MAIVALVLALLLTAPAIASAEIFFDFFWTSTENAFGSNPVSITGRSTATLRDTTVTLPSGQFDIGIFRFDGPPRTGSLDGLYGGDLEKLSDGIYQGGIDFPSALPEFGTRQGGGALFPTDGGFRAHFTIPGSGPDHGAIFSGTMTQRTVQAVEPTSVLLVVGALTGAAVLGRRRSTR